MKRTGRRNWRHRLDPGRKPFLKKILTVALVLECAYGIRQMPFSPGLMQQLITEDRVSQIEWVNPATGTEAAETDIYGFRFSQETGLFQFYHTRQSITDH